jgi:CheY-like chemotaxis protein
MNKSPSKSVSILVVDDQASNLHLYATLLRKAGYEVDTCDNGDACLQILEHKRYQVVLTDVVLGGKSGLDVLDFVRKGKGINKDTPIIVYTSDGSSVVRQQAATRGASMFLERPMPANELLSAVDLMVGDDAGASTQD